MDLAELDFSELEVEAAALRRPPATMAADADAGRLVDEDLLVEDVAIDGMCGVY